VEEVRPEQTSPSNSSRTFSKKSMRFQTLNIYSIVGRRLCPVANLTDLYRVYAFKLDPSHWTISWGWRANVSRLKVFLYIIHSFTFLLPCIVIDFFLN